MATRGGRLKGDERRDSAKPVALTTWPDPASHSPHLSTRLTPATTSRPKALDRLGRACGQHHVARVDRALASALKILNKSSTRPFACGAVDSALCPLRTRPLARPQPPHPWPARPGPEIHLRGAKAPCLLPLPQTSLVSGVTSQCRRAHCPWPGKAVGKGETRTVRVTVRQTPDRLPSQRSPSCSTRVPFLSASAARRPRLCAASKRHRPARPPPIMATPCATQARYRLPPAWPQRQATPSMFRRWSEHDTGRIAALQRYWRPQPVILASSLQQSLAKSKIALVPQRVGDKLYRDRVSAPNLMLA